MSDYQYCPCKACSSHKPPLTQLRRTAYNHRKKDEAAEQRKKLEETREKEKKRKAEEKKSEKKKASAKAETAISTRPPSSLDQPLEKSDSRARFSEFRAQIMRRREAEEEQIRRIERRAAYTHIIKVCQDAIDQLDDSTSRETRPDEMGLRLLSPEPYFPGLKRRREVDREEQVRPSFRHGPCPSPAQDDTQDSPALRSGRRYGGIEPGRPSLAERSRARRRERAEREAREAGASHIENGEPSDAWGQDEGVLITDML